MEAMDQKLKSFLNLFWLRPENGLLCTFKSLVFSDIELTSPSLDISCGDGLFMYLHLGGELKDNFDYFSDTRAKDFSHSKFIDIYDVCHKEYTPEITRKAAGKIDFGTDWKQGLLDKAESLSLYDKLVLHDNNIIPLPFPDNSFRSIYSNSIYWVKNVEGMLNDIHRILMPGGRAVLEVMTPFLLETLNKLEKYLSPEAIAILNRQRRETMRGPRKYDEWKKIILSSGLKIEEARSVYPNRTLIDIWNIGLRPVSHLLIRMTDSLDREERLAIKREWVDIFHTLFRPLLSLPVNYNLDDAPYLCWIVKK